MPLLVYCVSRPEQIVNPASGVAGAVVRARRIGGLQVYTSEIADPAERFGNAESLKEATLQFQQVLREILLLITPIPFRFPMMVESEEDLERHLEQEKETYRAALERIGGAVQYEMVGTWAADEQTDIATPVSGKQYLERREQELARVEAIDSKLRRVTGDLVAEWRRRQDRRAQRWFALVPRQNREKFIAALKSAGPSQGFRMRLTGPWPPSEFIVPREDLDPGAPGKLPE